MKLRLVIFGLLILIIGQIKAQIFPSDSIKFIRYIENTKRKVYLPLTKLLYLHNTKIETDFNSQSECLRLDSLYDLIIIESDPFGLPVGNWNKFEFGHFQLEIVFKNGEKRISLDSTNGKIRSIRLINDYATRIINNPKITFNGYLEFGKNLHGKIDIYGEITIMSKNPITRHEIIFNNAMITSLEYAEYHDWELEYDQNIKKFPKR